MSFLNQNPHAFSSSSPGPAPVLEGVASSSVPRPAPFSQPFVPQAGGPSDPPSFNFQILRSLRMHATLAVLVGLAVCLLLVVLGLKQPLTYTASSVIYVEPMVARNLNEQGVPGFDQFRYGSFLDQQIQTIVRPDVLTAALRSLPAGTWRGPLESEQSAVARLSKALTVERVLTSYQITVQLKASNPQAAAAIVNAVTTAYLQRGREDEFKQADLREQILSEERDRVKEELETDRKEQAALGASMGLASPADGAGNPYDADLANLRSQLATARQARDVAAAQLSSVSGPSPDQHSGLTASADDLINSDPGLSAKKAAVNARRVVLESMMAGMTPSNPQYRQAQDEIADLDRALEAKTAEVRAQTERRIQDKLRTDLQRTADVESKLNAQLAQATAKATGAGPKLQRAAELANDIQRLTARYTTVDDALNALQLETSGPGMAHVPLPAAVPLTPDPNHRDLFFMAALPLGLLFGVSAAVLARLRDPRVYMGSDLQQAIGFAPIAVLPAREDVSDRVIEEYVLRLAAGVESAYRTGGAQSFVVTGVSADTDTGTLLRDLANKLEDLRLRVLTIRASELLVTSQETMEHQAATAALIAAGAAPRPIQAGEGIASAKLDRMKGQHDVILIDAAPVLHSAETEYAARCADATILVAEAGVTQRSELAVATALLSRLRVTGVGAVLAQVKLEQADEQFRSAVHVVEQRSLDGVVSRKPSMQQDTAAVRPERKPAPASPSTAVPSAADAARTQAPVAAAKPVEATPAAGVAEARPDVAAAVTAPIPAPAVLPAEPQADTLCCAPAAAAQTAVIASKPDRAFAAIPAAAASKIELVDSFVPAVQPEPRVSPATTAAVLPVSKPEETIVRPQLPRPSFKNWTASPAISPEESEQVIARPGVRKRFELLGDLADAAPAVASSSADMLLAANGMPLSANSAPPAPVSFGPLPAAQPEPPRAALHAASAKMQLPPAKSTKDSQRAPVDAAKGDDPHAVGRFVGEKDTIGAVPSYTRSKIRLAFKEQEVNSKTTWFSKLFRGDPPATFRIIPDDADEDDRPPIEAARLQWEQPPSRLPEPVADDDPELSHLLNRIKTSGEMKVPPRPRPVAVEPQTPSGPPVPFVERRTMPRPIEIDEYRAAVAPAPVLAAPVAVSPEPFAWEPPAPTPLTPPLPPAPASFAAPLAASVPPVPPTPEPAANSPAPGRPLRPLTFQQLAGSIEAEALHEQPQSSLRPQPESQPQPRSQSQPQSQPQPTPQVQSQSQLQSQLQSQPIAAPKPAVQIPEMTRQTTSAAHAEVVPTPVSFTPAPDAVDPVPASLEWETPAVARQPAPEPPPPASPAAATPVVTSVGHTGVPLWPAKEPLVSTYAPPYAMAEFVQAPEPATAMAPAPVEAVESKVDAPASPAAATEQPVPPEHPDEKPAFFAPSPSARRGAFERIPIIPDPLTDPSPAQRPYRLEAANALERSPAPEPHAPAPAPAPEPVATVPAGTSFPPDHEARLQMLGRRKSDHAAAGSNADIPGLTRRWKLLSQFEPVVTDPLPAHRKGYTRVTDVNPPRRNDEG